MFTRAEEWDLDQQERSWENKWRNSQQIWDGDGDLDSLDLSVESVESEDDDAGDDPGKDDSSTITVQIYGQHTETGELQQREEEEELLENFRHLLFLWITSTHFKIIPALNYWEILRKYSLPLWEWDINFKNVKERKWNWGCAMVWDVDVWLNHVPQALPHLVIGGSFQTEPIRLRA